MTARFWLFAFILLFHACRSSVDEQVIVPVDAVIPAAKMDSTKSTLRLIFAGDIMGHGPQIRSAERNDGASYDYTPCFQYVQPIFEQADLVIGNLELTLPGEPPYQGYPYFRSPDALGTALRQAGFDLLLTSNNHCNDAHQQGLEQTIQSLRAQHFYQTGTFTSHEDRDLLYPLIVYRNSFKLAFLNYTYGVGRKSRYDPLLVNKTDIALIEKDLWTARQMQADAIILYMHWGREYQDDESSVQRKMARQFLRWGADLVIGAHPHVVQPVEERFMKKKDGTTKKTLVAYSLGNFISNQRKPKTDGGILLEVDLVKEKGETRIADYAYYPFWRYIHRSEDKRATFYTLPLAIAPSLNLSDKDQRKMNRYARHIRKHLSECREAGDWIQQK